MNNDLTFGLTLTIIGMSGTLLSLLLLSFLVSLLKKVIPYKPESTARQP